VIAFPGGTTPPFTCEDISVPVAGDALCSSSIGSGVEVAEHRRAQG
jgi:hypothetical protein